MEFYYSADKNAQIIVSLLKAHNIRKVIISPGTTNISFVASVQNDPWFTAYSAADERSAAYMACGMAAESGGEPVVLSCTGATASRNYLPALTEAFYRKLPIVALTATLHEGRLGQNFPQAIDRRCIASDVCVMSVQLPIVHTEEDLWANNLKVNSALLALHRNGGGPVHVNWCTESSRDYSIKVLPPQRVIKSVSVRDAFPPITVDRVAIFIGAHQPVSERLTALIDHFCEKYNGIVLCDQTSNYRGKYRILGNLVTYQELCTSSLVNMPLLIYIGNVSGAYMKLQPASVWRVNPDGEARDCFKCVKFVFAMEESEFFERYIDGEAAEKKKTTYFEAWQVEHRAILEKLPEVPFSNIWAAKTIANQLPAGSVLHLGILNYLRSWNFFETPASVTVYANTGGFGIDGDVSSLVGASLVHPEKLYFGVVGDLAFFYDMNSIGNRHVSNNIRLMVVNNGRGTEFRNYNHAGAIFGAQETDRFVAAAGHYGNQSPMLLKHYVQDLGFEYLSAKNKTEFLNVKDRFLATEKTEKPMLLELFTDSAEESEALKSVNRIQSSASGTAKQLAKNVLGHNGVVALKKLIKK